MPLFTFNFLLSITLLALWSLNMRFFLPPSLLSILLEYIEHVSPIRYRILSGILIKRSTHSPHYWPSACLLEIHILASRSSYLSLLRLLLFFFSISVGILPPSFAPILKSRIHLGPNIIRLFMHNHLNTLTLPKSFCFLFTRNPFRTFFLRISSYTLRPPPSLQSPTFLFLPPFAPEAPLPVLYPFPLRPLYFLRFRTAPAPHNLIGYESCVIPSPPSPFPCPIS